MNTAIPLPLSQQRARIVTRTTGDRASAVASGSGERPVGSAILLPIGGLLLSVSGVMLHSVQHLVKRVQEGAGDALAGVRIS